MRSVKDPSREGSLRFVRYARGIAAGSALRRSRRPPRLMLVKSFLLLTASLLALACSSKKVEPAAAPGDDAAIIPRDLTVTARAGGNGVLSVLALTLRKGAEGGELYAAVKNVGDTPACSPAFSVELFDKDEQSLGQSVGGLLVRRFYRLTDGSETIAACVAPGDVSMIALTELPLALAAEDVARVEYWCNYWVLDVTPIPGIDISSLRAVSRDAGVAYTGTFVNRFEVPMSSPSVAVFPLNRAGRPLSVAMSRAAAELPPGGSWDFETSSVSERGVAQAAYPTGGP